VAFRRIGASVRNSFPSWAVSLLIVELPARLDHALMAPMPGLTRRRNLEAPDECWHIFYGDVRVGTIALRTGIPHHEQPWGWACGFYPGCHPSEYTDGTAETFDQARAEFETAWRMFLSNRTEADFQEWRDQRDWTAEKYRRFDRHEPMPPDWRASG